jgi:hypothetical protein
MSAPAAGSPGSPRASSLSAGALVLVLVLVLALVALLGCGAGAGGACVAAHSTGGGPGGCGAGVAGTPPASTGPTAAGTGPTAAAGATGTARSDGLVLALTVKPAVVGVGAPVEIELAARAARAPGAIGYLLRYGDGATSGSGAVPQFCLAGPAPSVRRVWRTTHRYRASGGYVVSASVYVNCTRERAVATTRVLVR